MGLSELPDVLIATILSLLHTRILARAARVCRSWSVTHVPAAAAVRAKKLHATLPKLLHGEAASAALQFVEAVARRTRGRITASAHHVIFVHADGRARVLGGFEGRAFEPFDPARQGPTTHLGIGIAEGAAVLRPTAMHVSARAVSVAADGGRPTTHAMSYVVTEDGVVLASGEGGSGTFGRRDSSWNRVDSIVETPTAIPGLQGLRIIHVACGQSHTLALSAFGTLFSWGQSYVSAALGHAARPPGGYEQVRQIDALRGTQIVDCAAAGHHSLAVSAEGDAYSWGENKKGRLGNGLKSGSSNLPGRVHLPAGVRATEVSAGFHSLCVTATNEAYGWGLNNMEQLGSRDDGGVEHYKLLPTRVQTDERIVHAAAGAFSSAFTTIDGQVLVSGNIKLDFSEGQHYLRRDQHPVVRPLALGIQVAEVVIPGHSGERSEDNFIVLRALDGGIFVYGKRFPEVLTFSAYARGNLEYDDAVATLCDLNMMGSEEQ